MFDWSDGMWWAQLVLEGYVPNGAVDTDLAALDGYTIGSPVALSGQVVSSAGVLSANSPTFAGIESGNTVQAVVIYHLDGDVSWLCFYMDTGPGLPITSTGLDIQLDFNLNPVNGSVYAF